MKLVVVRSQLWHPAPEHLRKPGLDDQVAYETLPLMRTLPHHANSLLWGQRECHPPPSWNHLQWLHQKSMSRLSKWSLSHTQSSQNLRSNRNPKQWDICHPTQACQNSSTDKLKTGKSQWETPVTWKVKMKCPSSQLPVS